MVEHTLSANTASGCHSVEQFLLVHSGINERFDADRADRTKLANRINRQVEIHVSGHSKKLHHQRRSSDNFHFPERSHLAILTVLGYIQHKENPPLHGRDKGMTSAVLASLSQVAFDDAEFIRAYAEARGLSLASVREAA